MVVLHSGVLGVQGHRRSEAAAGAGVDLPLWAVHDRDVNAARNILAAGRADSPTLVELVSAGAPVPQPAVKREPAGSTA